MDRNIQNIAFLGNHIASYQFFKKLSNTKAELKQALLIKKHVVDLWNLFTFMFTRVNLMNLDKCSYVNVV